MEWIVLEEVDEGAARLIALRPSTGDRRLLYRSEHPFPLRPSLHPDGTRIALDAVSRNVLRGEYRARVGVVNLESGGVGWLKQSLDPKWRVGGAIFDDTGRRLAIEGAYGGAPLTELYVVDVSFTGNSAKETIVAGAGNRLALGTAAPRFLPGGRRLVYLHNTRPDGAWEVYLLDLDQSGDSAFSMEGRAPSVLSMPLTDNAQALPDAGLCFSPERERVFFVGLTRGRTRQRLRWTPLDGGGVVDLGREHMRIEEIVAAPGTDLVAYAADGNVYLADAESCEVQVLVRGEPTNSHRGLIFDPDAGGLWFATTDSDGASVRFVDLDTREVREVIALGPGVAVVHALGLPDSPRSRQLVQRLPEAGVGLGGSTSEIQLAEAGDDNRATAVTRVGPSRTDTVPNYQTRGLSTAQDAVPRSSPPGAKSSPADAKSSSPAAPEPDPDEPGPRERTQVTAMPRHVAEAAKVPPAPPPEALTRSTPSPVPQPAASQMPPPEAPAASIEVTDSMETDAQTGVHKVAPSEKPRAPLPTLSAANPREDFVGWMKSLGNDVPPVESLRLLSDSEVQTDARVRDAARMYLGSQVRKASGGEGLNELVNAIGAAGYLKLHEGEGALRQLCERLRERLRGDAGLPEVEEHFALAALRTIRLGSRFDFDEVYEEYESMLAQSAAVLENAGEAAVAEVIGTFSQLYQDLLNEAFGATDADAQRARDRQVANAHAPRRTGGTLTGVAVPKSLGQGAAVPNETPSPSRPRAPEPEAPRPPTAAVEPARAAPLPEPARAPTPLPEPARVAPKPAAANIPGLPREGTPSPSAAVFAPAPERLPALSPPLASPRPQLVAADEDEEFARLRARAQVAAQPPLSPTPTPTPRPARRSDFNPFGDASPTPGPAPSASLASFPAQTPAPVRPQPAPQALPPAPTPARVHAPLDDLDLDSLSSGISGDISMSLPPPPWYVPIVGGAAGIGGLMEVIVGAAKLGTVFLLLGVLTLASGFGLLGDRRWGYLAAGPAFAANAVFLVVFAADNPPKWMPPMALLFFAAAAALAFIVMILPDVRARYTSRRGRL